MFLQVLRTLEGLATEVTFVRLQRDMDTDPLHHAAHDVELFFGAVEQIFGARKLGRGDGCDEPDAHVECAHHLFLRHVAQLAQVFEDGQHRPRSDLDLRPDALGQNARQILRNAAAGDVRHARGEPARHQLLDDVR